MYCGRRGRATRHRALLVLGAALGASLLVGGCASSSAPKAAKATSFAFWPLPPAEPRIQFVRSFQAAGDLNLQKASGLQELIFGKEDVRDTAIEKPYGVAMRNGRIYVCDIRYPALTVMDLTNRQMRRMGTTGVNHLTHPVDVAVADDGWVYVADNDRNAVLVYDTNERYARTIGESGMTPVALATHGDRLYVCDIKGQNVAIFNRGTGELLGKFGQAGDGDGEFRVPLAVDVDRAGDVYVTDMMRCRVQKFGPDGGYKGGVGELGDYAGSFARPKQLAVDSDGVVYVVDAAFQNVQMFNDEFALLMSFGAGGNFPGAMNLPAGICVSDDRLDLVKDLVHEGFEPKRYVAVTNQFGPAKVSLYVMGQLRPGYSVADLAPASVEVSEGVGQNEASKGLSALEGPEPGEGDVQSPEGGGLE